jgi:hypothetical protein
VHTQITGGQWLNILVSADATLVLCGSVLTSYVGIIGLVRRMTLDRFANITRTDIPLTTTTVLWT